MTIAIVANGSSLLTLKKGREIDDHDIVIRMNLFYRLRDREITGLKTDIWSCCFDKVDIVPFEEKEVKDIPVIWCARPMYWDRDLSHWQVPGWAKSRITREINDGEYYNTHILIGKYGGNNPTTGILSFIIAEKVFPNVVKDLYGYDFYEPKGWYYKGSDEKFDVFHHHSPRAEKLLVEEWQKQGRVNRITQ